MNNIKNFSMFEGNGKSLWTAMDNAYSEIIMVYTLMDEGYLTSDGELKDTTWEDCVDYCNGTEMSLSVTEDDIKGAIEDMKKIFLKG